MISTNQTNIAGKENTLTYGNVDAQTQVVAKSNNIKTYVDDAVSNAQITLATQLSDISSAGSGAIITSGERTLITTNQTNIAGKENTLTYGNVDAQNPVVVKIK